MPRTTHPHALSSCCHKCIYGTFTSKKGAGSPAASHRLIDVAVNESVPVYPGLRGKSVKEVILNLKVMKFAQDLIMKGRSAAITSSGWCVAIRTSSERKLGREGPKTRHSRTFHLSEAFNLYFSCSTSQRIMDGIFSCAGSTSQRRGASMLNSLPD